MDFVNNVERILSKLIFHFKDGETAFLECKTNDTAEEILCLLLELEDKKKSSLWVHEYWGTKYGCEVEHIMEY